jgi:hypothetical protein
MRKRLNAVSSKRFLEYQKLGFVGQAPPTSSPAQQGACFVKAARYRKKGRSPHIQGSRPRITARRRPGWARKRGPLGASPVSKKTLGGRRERGIDRSGDSRIHRSVDSRKGREEPPVARPE